jgi:hypothetical protein
MNRQYPQPLKDSQRVALTILSAGFLPTANLMSVEKGDPLFFRGCIQCARGCGDLAEWEKA